MMISLLDSATQRRMRLLAILNESNDWISSSNLAKKLKVSLRTINSDIHYLKTKWYPILQIYTSKQNGVRLSVAPNQTLRILNRYAISHSETYNLIESIFYRPRHSSVEWSYELDIPEASLRRMISKARTEFKERGITLHTRPLYMDSSDEYSVRFFFVRYFLESSDSFDWGNDINPFELADFYRAMMSELYGEHMFFFAEYFVCYAYVSIIRMSQGFYALPLDYRETEHFLKIKAYLSAHIHTLQRIVNPIKLTFDDRFINDITNSFVNITGIDNAGLVEPLNRLITTLEEAFNFPISKSNRNAVISTVKLDIHLRQVNIYPDYILFNSEKNTSKPLRSNYVVFTEVVVKALKEFIYPIIVHHDQDLENKILMDLLTLWEHLPLNLENRKRKANILIISTISRYHANLIKDLVNYRFLSRTKITVMYNDRINAQINPSTFTNYDVIVSTDIIAGVDPKKSLIIEIIPSERNWTELARLIQNSRRIEASSIPYLNK